MGANNQPKIEGETMKKVLALVLDCL